MDQHRPNHNRARRGQLCCLAVAAGLLFSHGAQGSSYLQDAFNCPPGVLGTNSPWTSPTNLITVISSNLVYSGLADFSPPGNAASVAQGSATSAAVTYRPFDTAATGGSVYFSFLIKFTHVDANVYFAGLLPPTVGLPNGPASDPCDLTVKLAGSGYNLGIRAKGSGVVATNAPSVLALNTVHFMVAKHDFNSCAASLYLNPFPGGLEPASPDAVSTGTASVASLDHLFLRVANSTTGNFLIDTLRVASTWADVTPLGEIAPATKLVFATTPTAGTAGSALDNVVVQIQNADAFNLSSNAVPITVSLNPGSFAGGTTTVNSDAHGRAIFSDLVVGTPGTYTLTASASGIGAGLAAATSGSVVIGSAGSISEQGNALSAFLDSLQVEQYWSDGVSVNWLTGAAGGSGPNMTVGTASHCSAFAAGVADVLGVYLLRPPDASDLNLANNQADWLRTNTVGWHAIPSMTDAQHLANIGILVMASYKDASGSGHIAIVRPSTRSDADIQAFGPQECQSGVNNYNSTNVMIGFNQHQYAFPNGILYYGHARTNPIVPVNSVFGPHSLSNGVFRANATSIVGRAYKLQWSSNFVTWSNVLAFTNSNNSSNFFCLTPLTDSPGTGSARRFYRLLAQ